MSNSLFRPIGCHRTDTDADRKPVSTAATDTSFDTGPKPQVVPEFRRIVSQNPMEPGTFQPVDGLPKLRKRPGGATDAFLSLLRSF